MSEARILASELHKPKRKRYPTRRVIAYSIDETWQADIAVLTHLKKWNRGYAYLLTVIDVFSKFGFARPLKTKTGSEVTDAFQSILRKSGRTPKNLHTDRGTEFFNRIFQKLLKEYGIYHYHTYTDKKASVVERWNRTLKTKMYRKFSELNTWNWISSLQDLVEEYNNTDHRSIRMKPVEVSKMNESDIFSRLYGKKNRKGKKRFKIGDLVRISREKSTFAKGFTPNWTEELFKVTKERSTRPRTYLLEDLQGVPIKGSFYTQEMQKTQIPKYARIEKVIGRKTEGGKKWIRVKWMGYDSRFNEWIPLESSKKL